MTSSLLRPFRYHRLKRLLPLLLVGVVGLSGCGLTDAPPPCPPAGVPSAVSNATTFVEGAGQDLTEVRYTAEVSRIGLTCDYDDDGVELTVGVEILAERGPADRARKAEIAYFIAVEQGAGNITAKEIYTVELPFEGNRRRVGVVEKLEVFVPRPVNGSYANLRIIGGLQLTESQLEYNKRISGR